ncbi:hypothetical protein, partial [Gilvimarinus sp. 1_MG-2023]|uniref:hypothetical protein n=1 Tax=Gilvimarinus sp. 1_MG-2023 TaxID=3062638 RepID=UPI0026E27327
VSTTSGLTTFDNALGDLLNDGMHHASGKRFVSKLYLLFAAGLAAGKSLLSDLVDPLIKARWRSLKQPW